MLLKAAGIFPVLRSLKIFVQDQQQNFMNSTLPQQMTLASENPRHKRALFLNFILPFLLAAVGIPVYLMVVLKLIAAFQG